MLARAHAKQHAGHNQERGHTGAPTLTRPAGTSTHTHTILLDTGREHEHELRAPADMLRTQSDPRATLMTQ